MWLKKHSLSSRGISDDLLSHKNCAPYNIASKQGSPKGPVCGLYLGSYQVIPKRNYYGAHGQSMLSRRSYRAAHTIDLAPPIRLPENPPAPHPGEVDNQAPQSCNFRGLGETKNSSFVMLHRMVNALLSCRPCAFKVTLRMNSLTTVKT